MKRAFGQMALGNLIAAAIGAFVVIISARSLTPYLWAEAAIIIGVGPALGIVLSLGSVSFQIREISSNESASERRRLATLFNVRRATLATLLVVAGALIVLAGSTSLGWIAVVGAVRFARGGLGVLYSGELKFGHLSLFLICEKASCLILVALAAALEVVTPELVGVAYLTSYCVYSLLCIAFEGTSFRKADIILGMRTPWRIWDGSRSFGVTSLVGPAQQLDVSVVNLIVGPSEAGLFASASRMVGSLNVAGSALASVALPYLSSGDYRVKSVPWRKLLVAGGCGVIAVGAVSVSAPVWVPLLLGSEYVMATGAISIYIWAILILTLNQPLMAALQARRDEKFVMWVAVCQSLLGLCGVGLGAGVGGAQGAAAGYLVVSIVILVVLASRFRSRFSEG